MPRLPFRVALAAIIFLMFLTAYTSSGEQVQQSGGQEKKTDQTVAEEKAEFERQAKARFEEYDRRLKEFNEKAKVRGEAFFWEQKRELDAQRAQAKKYMKRLKAAGEKGSTKMKQDLAQALENFRKALEKAEAKLREK